MTDTTLFYRFSHSVARAAGKPRAFVVAVAAVVLWAVTGPIFHFSETWQLVINTGTTIVTFLMVFLVQNTQNRDGEAVQAKLDELILVTRASNTFIGAEQLTGEELTHLRSIVADKAKRHEADEESRQDEKKAARGAAQPGAARSRKTGAPSGK